MTVRCNVINKLQSQYMFRVATPKLMMIRNTSTRLMPMSNTRVLYALRRSAIWLAETQSEGPKTAYQQFHQERRERNAEQYAADRERYKESYQKGQEEYNEKQKQMLNSVTNQSLMNDARARGKFLLISIVIMALYYYFYMYK